MKKSMLAARILCILLAFLMIGSAAYSLIAMLI